MCILGRFLAGVVHRTTPTDRASRPARSQRGLFPEQPHPTGVVNLGIIQKMPQFLRLLQTPQLPGAGTFQTPEKIARLRVFGRKDQLTCVYRAS
jgi:hypothetical protein